MQVFRSVEVKCTDVLNCQLRRVPLSSPLPPLPLCPSLPLVPSSVYRPRDRGPAPCAIINQPRPAGRSYCRVGEFMETIDPAASGPRLRLREDCPGSVISLRVREGGWVAGDPTRKREGWRAGGTDAPQMMVGTRPLPLFRLLLFRDRLGVAMSTKRSSGQPYCSRTSMHSWLEACRA